MEEVPRLRLQVAVVTISCALVVSTFCRFRVEDLSMSASAAMRWTVVRDGCCHHRRHRRRVVVSVVGRSFAMVAAAVVIGSVFGRSSVGAVSFFRFAF